ncbi:MAG: hypothetical protein PHR98_03145 [Candidatus Shapirobacteria bacterium]|jgi:hypothetical protein|nr:hypothetical protein [Candidatus Shapirobacteria bacterium]
MSVSERCHQISVNLSPINSFELGFLGKKQLHRLVIDKPNEFAINTPKLSQDLLRTVSVAHLIAPYFPEIIETNFGIEYREFIDELYKFYGYKTPTFRTSDERVKILYKTKDKEDFSQISHANAHSGGLDSVFRIVNNLINKESVLAVHLQNLNCRGASNEASASSQQCQEWGVPFENIKLINSTESTNFDTMRTRDMFLALVVGISAYKYGVKDVLIEGGMSDDPSQCQFTEYTKAWEMFNKMIESTGLNLEVKGVDPGDIETIGEILKFEKELGIEILPLIQNCFSSPHQVGNNRRKWERETPVLAESSSYHWCGSCYKCRRMSLGRIYYADPKLGNISQNEINFFVRDTYQWMKNYPHNAVLVSDSFKDHLESLNR